mgnify:CR=1 FL=1
MTKIKDASIIFLIVFIIASILYAIHLFRYEFIVAVNEHYVIRYDRITNTQCYSSRYLPYNVYSTGDISTLLADFTEETKIMDSCTPLTLRDVINMEKSSKGYN